TGNQAAADGPTKESTSTGRRMRNQRMIRVGRPLPTQPYRARALYRSGEIRSRRISMPSYDFALILSRPFHEDELDPLFDRTHGAVTVSITSDPQHADRPPAPAHRQSNDELRSADRRGNASCSWTG